MTPKLLFSFNSSGNESQEYLSSTSNIGNETQDYRNSTYASVNESAYCIPDERPQIHSKKSLHRARYRFRLVQRNAICVDTTKNLTYEFGAFDSVHDSTECAEMCVNFAARELQPHLVGITYKCTSQECQCLYVQGTLNWQNIGPFNWTNAGTSAEKGTGSISNHSHATKQDAHCFSHVSKNFFDN
jgi:hypothetical protein